MAKPLVSDALTDKLAWARGGKKSSVLFIDLLRKLLKAYPDKKVVHVVPDNSCIHASRQTRQWVEQFRDKFRLHFLPPYDPDDNLIGRKLWREVHANVATNHNFGWIEPLCDQVVAYMTRHNARAALRQRRESRTAI